MRLKFFIYTFTASVVMLLSLITVYFLQEPQPRSALPVTSPAAVSTSWP